MIKENKNTFQALYNFCILFSQNTHFPRHFLSIYLKLWRDIQKDPFSRKYSSDRTDEMFDRR